MSWKYLEYQYASAQLIQKILIWISNVDAHIYFGFKGDTSSWAYYAGDGSHALATGSLLTNYATEAEAQTNYLSTSAYRESSGKVLMVMPSVYSAKYAKMFVYSGSGVAVYEWINSTYFTAHEIITGELTITDQLSSAPVVKIISGLTERLRLGNLNGSYGITNDYYGIGIGNYAGYYLRYDDNSGDLIVAGDIKTSPTVGTTKGIHLDITNNELYFYGDRGDTTIEKLASIGINDIGSGDYVIGLFGTEESTYRAIKTSSASPCAIQSSLAKGGVNLDLDTELYKNSPLTYAYGIRNYVRSQTTDVSTWLMGENILVERGYYSGDTGKAGYVYGIYMAIKHGVEYTPDTTEFVSGITIIPNLKSGPITTFKAINIEDGTTGAAITNNYAIYQESTVMTNFYAGYTLAKGGIRVGTTETDPGDNNLYVEGTSTFAGNITLADGVTLGQAAGPLLTFDDTNNYLEITGCSVGILTATPAAPLDIRSDLGLYIGAGNDLQITLSSDDVYFKNATQDKDIYIQVNDGGSTTTPLFIDSSATYVAVNSSTANARFGVWEGGLTLNYAAIEHGMTSYLPTNAFLNLTVNSTTEGGLDFRAASDTGSTIPLILRGLFGNNSGTNPAIMLYGAKKDGTGIQNLADTEIALAVNNGSVRLLTIDGAGNFNIKTATTETGATATLNIPNGTAPDAHVDNQIILYSADSSDSTATLALYLEQAVEDIGTFTASHKIKVFINGTAYWLQLDAV